MKEKEEEQKESQLCEKCGSILVDEGGEKICPKCQGEIKYFGEEEDEDL